MFDRLLRRNVNSVEKSEMEFKKKLIDDLYTVFYGMSDQDIPWMLKQLDILEFEELTQLLTYAHLEIQRCPAFNIQTLWYGTLFATRHSFVQSILIEAMIKTGGRIQNKTEKLPMNVFRLTTDYIVDGYAINFVYFIDSHNENDAALPMWSFFINGVFDTVLTPTVQWDIISKSFDVDTIKEGLGTCKSMRDLFSFIYNDMQKNLRPKDLTLAKECFKLNAIHHNWVELFETATKPTINNIIRLH